MKKEIENKVKREYAEFKKRRIILQKKVISIPSTKNFLPISILLIEAIFLFQMGCAGIPFSRMPSPRPGLVLFINMNEWAQGKVMVFEPGMDQTNLFVVSGGVFKIQNKPILQILIPAAPATNIPSISSAELHPSQSYSIVMVWENKVGQFIKFTYGSISTSDGAFNQSYTDFLGRQFWADQVFYLPTVSASEAQPYRLQIRPPE